MFQSLYLGRISYDEALALQQELVELRREDRIPNTLLLLEHPPVLTLGRNATRANILASDELLARRGVTLHQTNRGGEVTYHGPGQLIGYPIFDLRTMPGPMRPQGVVSGPGRMGAVDFVRQLEEVLIRLCAVYGIPAQRVAGRTGVWTLAGGSILERKIAAIGIHISRGITSHGFALNVTTDLRDFDLIIPCGIADREVTSMEREQAPLAPPENPNASPAEILERAANHTMRTFAQVVDDQLLALDSLKTLHEQIKQSEAQTNSVST
jgi:lipoyl(octanoyl) transferase